MDLFSLLCAQWDPSYELTSMVQMGDAGGLGEEKKRGFPQDLNNHQGKERFEMGVYQSENH